MSSNSESDIEAVVDQYTDDLDAEIVEAVDAIETVVDDAATAADESMDVAIEVKDILKPLSMGKTTVAVQAGLDLLDDQTGKEAQEAVGAMRVVADDAHDAWAELVDVADILSDGFVEVTDEVASLELPIDDVFGR